MQTTEFRTALKSWAKAHKSKIASGLALLVLGAVLATCARAHDKPPTVKPDPVVVYVPEDRGHATPGIAAAIGAAAQHVKPEYRWWTLGACALAAAASKKVQREDAFACASGVGGVMLYRKEF